MRARESKQERQAERSREHARTCLSHVLTKRMLLRMSPTARGYGATTYDFQHGAKEHRALR
eukprot:378664-Rhodomonas_salina.1